MVSRISIEKTIASIERRRLEVEKNRSIFQFETAFFMPLFAILFLVTYFSKSGYTKMLFYIITIIFIVADLIYSVLEYQRLLKKQEKLERLIHERFGREF